MTVTLTGSTVAHSDGVPDADSFSDVEVEKVIGGESS
jgi:hypothetical protein